MYFDQMKTIFWKFENQRQNSWYLRKYSISSKNTCFFVFFVENPLFFTIFQTPLDFDIKYFYHHFREKIQKL